MKRKYDFGIDWDEVSYRAHLFVLAINRTNKKYKQPLLTKKQMEILTKQIVDATRKLKGRRYPKKSDN